MDSEKRWELGRLPALDGLRGVAIGLVVACHAMPERFRNGGSVGVTVFFALSGFLITSLLLGERTRSGRISFGGFYLRRARRLLPALAVYLAVWTGLSAAGIGPFPVSAAEVIASAFYFANWLMAAGGMSHPTGITWSLSIEEQFYLIWPVTFLLARRWPRAQAAVAVAGIGVAVFSRLHMWGGPGARWAIYYHSETHMDSLLIGCLLAIAVHRLGTHWLRRPLGWLGIVILATLLMDQSSALKYLWEPTLATVAAAALIGSVLAGGSNWLSWPALRYLGRRSYALYLWHYPLLVLSWPGLRMIPAWAAVLLALAAAEASWWLVERPFMRRQATRPHVPVSGVGPPAPMPAL